MHCLANITILLPLGSYQAPFRPHQVIFEQPEESLESMPLENLRELEE